MLLSSGGISLMPALGALSGQRERAGDEPDSGAYEHAASRGFNLRAGGHLQPATTVWRRRCPSRSGDRRRFRTAAKISILRTTAASAFPGIAGGTPLARSVKAARRTSHSARARAPRLRFA